MTDQKVKTHSATDTPPKRYFYLIISFIFYLHLMAYLFKCDLQSTPINFSLIQFTFRYLDFINIMAYDLHGPWENVIGLNAPMRALPTDNPQEPDQLTVEASLS